MDKMRKEFEVQYLMHVCNYSRDIAEKRINEHKEEGYLTQHSAVYDFRYCHNTTDDAWWAWQASRAAQCVELPDNWIVGELGDDAAVYAVVDVKQALNEAGVNYK